MLVTFILLFLVLFFFIGSSFGRTNDDREGLGFLGFILLIILLSHMF